MLSAPGSAAAGGAPDWLRAQVSQPTPAHDGKTAAVVLYEATALTVLPNGRMTRTERVVYRILRPEGARVASHQFVYDPLSRITSLHGWCIPPAGKEYEVKERDAVDASLDVVQGTAWVSDTRAKLLVIPGATPGAVLGYEIEQEIRPYMAADEWTFEDTLPVREAQYSLQLPPGWNYEVNWTHHAPVEPVSLGPGRLQWTLSDVKAIRVEPDMPPWRGIAGRFSVSPFGAGAKPAMHSWNDIGQWYAGLIADRRQSTPEIRRRVAELTADAPQPIDKLRALARFVQTKIRYFAIELGIGGQQPHPAADTLRNGYGDCKDKATLLSAMLKEIGIDSDLVIINTERGAFGLDSPPSLAFNHAILAIRLTAELEDPALAASAVLPDSGRVLFFDPTDALTPLGRLPGGLQGNVGLLVSPAGGRLVELPRLPAALAGIERTGHFVVAPDGGVTGTVHEVRTGESAARMRRAMGSVAQASDQVRPVERELSQSLSKFAITKAGVANLADPEQPLVVEYTVDLGRFATPRGDMLLLRPTLVGELVDSTFNADEPRTQPIEFDELWTRKDAFDIELPAGYQIEDVPDPMSLSGSAATYHAKAIGRGRVLRFEHALELRQLSVPVSDAVRLQEFFRTVYGDEKREVVLTRVP